MNNINKEEYNYIRLFSHNFCLNNRYIFGKLTQKGAIEIINNKNKKKYIYKNNGNLYLEQNVFLVPNNETFKIKDHEFNIIKTDDGALIKTTCNNTTYISGIKSKYFEELYDFISPVFGSTYCLKFENLIDIGYSADVGESYHITLYRDIDYATREEFYEDLKYFIE